MKPRPGQAEPYLVVDDHGPGLDTRTLFRLTIQERHLHRKSPQRQNTVGFCNLLYVNAQPGEAEAQIAERQRLITAPPLAGPLPDAAVIIEVLLALIHAPKPDVVSIAALLASQGKGITREKVEAVWAHYELGKKKPALRRLRY